MKTIGRLAVGPMSNAIIESAFSYSDKNMVPLMLIASKNQVDWNDGYVFNTKQYSNFVKKLKKQYSKSDIYICRDHCGPDFNGNKTLKDTYKTIDTDLDSGFDLIHVDLCHLSDDHDKVLKTSRKMIDYILDRSPETLIEVGTDENNGNNQVTLKRIEKDMQFFTSASKPYYFVTQTGSLVKEDEQVGTFNRSYVKQLKKLADKYQLRLKEHNADFLTLSEIKKRQGLIDSVNIAPQLGIIQTQLTLQKALLYGLDVKPFLNRAYDSRKWKKWLVKNTSSNKYICSLIAGHYVFNSSDYQRLFAQIDKHEDFYQSIEKTMHLVFDFYISSLDCDTTKA